jgi:hypothetical protein
MITDRRPSNGGRRAEYDASDRLKQIPTPPSTRLVQWFEGLQRARDGADPKLLKSACQGFLESLADFYGVASPRLRLLGVRPHSTHEGRVSFELFGDYEIAQARMRLWTRTPMRKQWASARTLLSTLCHEFMHHLDVTRLGFPNSFHTIGFYERTHGLYLAATGERYYPLAWRRLGAEGRWGVDWGEIRRRSKAASHTG